MAIVVLFGQAVLHTAILLLALLVVVPLAAIFGFAAGLLCIRKPLPHAEEVEFQPDEWPVY